MGVHGDYLWCKRIGWQFEKELDQDIDEYVCPLGSVYDEHRSHSSLLARQATYAHRQDGYQDTTQLSPTTL